MYEPTYSDSIMDLYENMLESSLNPNTIISQVKGRPINVTTELIKEILGVLNSGIVLREEKW